MNTLAQLLSGNTAAENLFQAAKSAGGVFTLNIFLEAEKPVPVRLSVESNPEALEEDFNRFAVLINRNLKLSEVSLVAGAIGYALREIVHGESLSEPDVKHFLDAGSGSTELTFHYDSTSSCSENPDFWLAFELAWLYVQKGSPVRVTNRSGPNTKGTRLVQGIGDCEASFYICKE